MTKLEHSVEIEAPIEEVYEFSVEIDNYAEIFPGRIEIIKNYEGNPKVGDTFNLSGEVAGRRLKETMRFVELVPNARIQLTHVDGDMKSFKSIVVLESTGPRTRVTETWEYEPPYSFLGQILDAVKIRKDLENYLVESHRKTKGLLERSRQ